MNDKPVIAVWFSCGAASAVAAKKTIELYGSTHTIRVVNNPIKEEDTDNLRFLKDVEKWLGVTIEFAVNSKFPTCSAVDVWEARQFMCGPKGAPCTGELKIKARQEWERNNECESVVMGYTLEEYDRHKNFKRNQRDSILAVLINLKITKSDCFRIIQEAGIELPRIYSMGYPNANCIGCVKATSPTYWNHVRKMHPDIFKKRADQSMEIGAKLVRYKGKRIFLDLLPPEAKGRKMKNMNFECGIFCEEKTA